MQRLVNNKPYLIYLTHENKEFEKRMCDILMNNIKNIDVKLFSDRSKLGESLIENINYVDLVMLDFLFDDTSLNRLENVLKVIHGKSPTAFLLFTNEKDFDEVKFKEINFRYPDLVYDFMNEHTFNEFIFVNRIRALLSIPRISKNFILQKEAVQNNLWMALDYSNLFVVILNKKMEVVLANYQLSKTLGFDDENKIIGTSWLDYLGPTDTELVKHVFEETILGNKSYEEFTNNIYNTGTKKSITVRWFNTLINSNFNCIFSIGVPIVNEPSVNDNVDAVRAYFTDILRKDRTTINAMKEVTMKYSKQLLDNGINK